MRQGQAGGVVEEVVVELTVVVVMMVDVVEVEVEVVDVVVDVVVVGQETLVVVVLAAGALVVVVGFARGVLLAPAPAPTGAVVVAAPGTPVPGSVDVPVEVTEVDVVEAVDVVAGIPRAPAATVPPSPGEATIRQLRPDPDEVAHSAISRATITAASTATAGRSRTSWANGRAGIPFSDSSPTS